jgi:hypothetical protein
MTSSATMLSSRRAIPFLRNAAGAPVTVEATRHCFDMALCGHKGDIGIPQPADVTALKDCVANDCASIVVSWPVSDYGAPRGPPKNVVNTLERTLRESHNNATTTIPFYVLDGGGRRMASLTLLRKPEGPCKGESVYPPEYDFRVAGNWLKYYKTSLGTISLR